MHAHILFNLLHAGKALYAQWCSVVVMHSILSTDQHFIGQHYDHHFYRAFSGCVSWLEHLMDLKELSIVGCFSKLVFLFSVKLVLVV